jgi:hypothetical protein
MLYFVQNNAMELYPVFTDVDIDEVYRDLNRVIYMLHYVDEEIFSKKEIREVCFSLQVAINTLDQKLRSR